MFDRCHAYPNWLFYAYGELSFSLVQMWFSCWFCCCCCCWRGRPLVVTSIFYARNKIITNDGSSVQTVCTSATSVFSTLIFFLVHSFVSFHFVWRSFPIEIVWTFGITIEFQQLIGSASGIKKSLFTSWLQMTQTTTTTTTATWNVEMILAIFFFVLVSPLTNSHDI